MPPPLSEEDAENERSAQEKESKSAIRPNRLGQEFFSLVCLQHSDEKDSKVTFMTLCQHP